MKSSDPGCLVAAALSLFVNGTWLIACGCVAACGGLAARAYGQRAGALAIGAAGIVCGWWLFSWFEAWEKRVVERRFGAAPDWIRSGFGFSPLSRSCRRVVYSFFVVGGSLLGLLL